MENTPKKMILYEDLDPAQKAAVDSPRRLDRTYAALEGLGLDRLAEDPEWQVREEVANQGYALEALKSDPSPIVRAAVAAQGFELERFAEDPAWECRYAVAKQGACLEKLAADPDPYVQQAAEKALSERSQADVAHEAKAIPRRTAAKRRPEQAERRAREQAHELPREARDKALTQSR